MRTIRMLSVLTTVLPIANLSADRETEYVGDGNGRKRPAPTMLRRTS